MKYESGSLQPRCLAGGDIFREQMRLDLGDTSKYHYFYTITSDIIMLFDKLN